MDINATRLGRRDFLRGSLAAAALAATGSLAACATSGTGTTSQSSAPAGQVSDTNPFGVQSGSTVDAVIFKGGYGIRLRGVRRQAGRGKATGRDGEGDTHHQGRPNLAAPLRRGQPAGRHRQ
jgi:hypothetical protein